MGPGGGAGVDAGEIVDEPVGAGGEREIESGVEEGIEAFGVGVQDCAVEDVLGVDATGGDVGEGFESHAVVTPEDGGAVAAGGVDAALEGDAVGAGLHDAGAEADGVNELCDVEEHDVAVAFSVAVEIMAVFFAVAEDDTGA